MHDFLSAARAENAAAALRSKDQRNQIIQETVLTAPSFRNGSSACFALQEAPRATR